MNETKQPPSTPGRKGAGFRTAGKIAGFTVLWLILFGVLAGLVGAGAVTGYIASLVNDDPIRSRSLIEEKINENAITGFVYFNDGTPIGQLRSEEDRRPVTYDQIPKTIIDAVVAIEDKNFFTHPGVDTNGLFRAVKQQLLNESVQTGGSTITQQLARRVFLSLDQTSSRKAKEIFLSLRLERFLSKEEIITAYLNKVPYGNGSSGYQVFGIKAASKGIFGIEKLEKLNIAQAAYLAGVPQLPSLYSAFNGKGDFNEKNFKRAVERQKLVLSRMLIEKKITNAEYEEALAFDLYSSLAKPSEKAYNTFPYLMLEVERQAAELLVLKQNPELKLEDLKKKENSALIEDARGQLLRSGYKITTTIDKKVYNLMHGVAENPENFAPDHPVKGVEQIAAVMMDQKTGAILGMIEGRDFHIEQMNFATQMTRQPGSAMKPIGAYLPAIDKGLIQPASVLDDAPIILKNGGGGYHIPKNSNNRYSGLVTARQALNNSYNIPALKIFLNKVTIKDSWAFARSLGITTLVKEDDAAQTGVIGGLKYGVSVEELTNAYSAIANKGVFNDAYLIESIRDANNEFVYKHEANPKRIVSEQSAYLMTDMLRTVVTNGTATSIMSQFKNYGKIPVVGKTGTTQNYGDVWFEGYTPDITLGVWAGYEKVIHTLSADSHGRARSIWAKIMNEVTEAKPELFPTKAFEKPDGIVSMTVSSVSGKLPTEITKSAGKLVTDIFNRKFIPTEEDDALVKVKYISYNGVNYLPHPETPEDLLRESVMVVRETPLDTLIEELQAKLGKVSAQSRKSLAYYLPKDAAQSAPSKIDPRVDDGGAPRPPAHISVETMNGLARISFTPSTQADVAGYRLYRSVNGGAFEKVEASVPTGEDPKFVNYISSNQTYRYYVAAVDVVGNESAPSESISTDGGQIITDPNIPDGGDPGFPDNPNNSNNPTTPTGLKAEGTDIGVTLSWNENPGSEGVTQYQVWYSSTERGKYKLLGTTESASFEYIAPMSTGWYRITAINSSGESSPTRSVEV
ncbi:transglycosylase domain-containing protein [Cohnella silvisoli]|uniref:Transglycosylase domain-containing protein n=1 Tax=Cohnella silvisoli TaxID=2873699 RepID=A0ABV1KZ04_9BACL|nr:transglycosylase domain-containing protein [Cohnella silvisoli]MCD9024241.1 transglycosylase domain-containing protein [Cohnella silvisoli]